MSNSSNCPVFRASTAGELVRLLPHFFGFPPKDSVILLTMTGTRINAAARIDASVVLGSDPKTLRASLVAVGSPDIVIGWTGDERSAERAANLVTRAVGGASHRIIVSGERCRLDDGQWVDLPPELTGEGWVADRAALAAQVAGPGAGASIKQWRAARHRAGQMELDDGCDRAAALLAAGLASTVSLADKLELAALVSQGAVRDSLWAMLTPHNAQDHVRFWKDVVQVVPDAGAPAVLGMLGMAAWVSGFGALQMCCLERGLALQPKHSLLRLVEAINLAGVPPRAWGDIQASLQGQDPSPDFRMAAHPLTGRVKVLPNTPR